ncbi:Phosphoethanolamine transferase eptB [Serratia quinivorans]|uniref:Phosphoethanolamine transferase eptB n=1 Tax=Serratia quinivorans TaxID=137545 RepID=A0A379YC82_9GAMM|nr:Phosphoethanolamine transferase eptB [Serratia quinivorans]
MMASYGGVVAGSYSPSNWLSALGLLTYSSYSQAEDSRNLFDPAAHFTYQPPKDVNDLYVVFVIGESARRDHMGIYGYQRDNTPNLDKETKPCGAAGLFLRHLDQALATLHVCERRRCVGRTTADPEGNERIFRAEKAGVFLGAVFNAERSLVLQQNPGG